MINKNDFRIGNVVMSPLGKPCKLREEDFTWDEFEYSFSLIELNEEWILNFGFNVSEGLFGESYTLNDISIWTSSKGNLCFCWDRCMKEIKYVHQLQNLYFALTGEELTLQNGSR